MGIASQACERLQLCVLNLGVPSVLVGFNIDTRHFRLRHVGERWETWRRREPDHHSCIIELAKPGRLARAVVETTYCKGNLCCSMVPQVWNAAPKLADQRETLAANAS
ncbi:hypothetical protein [Caballeronia sp. GAWG1-1]|uniref:hypothetical protein n=1 Tax=Caballeronia sp. GAWG1-1 TaxID=2921742 RepID=UPI0032EAD072